MGLKKKLKPKKTLRIIGYVLGTILIIIIGFIIFYFYERYQLTELGYTVKAQLF